ncbi:hypothetical protein ID867_19975 [Streptomyces parvulus]|nr:hypothetical protein [Streptomyces parvulus]
MNWVPVPETAEQDSVPSWAVVGGAASGDNGYPDWATLVEAVGEGEVRAPDVVLLPVSATGAAITPAGPGAAAEDVPARVRAAVHHTLTGLRPCSARTSWPVPCSPW